MTKIIFAAGFAVSVMIAANWFAGFVFRDAYSHQLVVDIPDFDEAPLVNRAALQRSWPNGMSKLSMRAQVRAQMQDVENLEPPSVSPPSHPTPERRQRRSQIWEHCLRAPIT